MTIITSQRAEFAGKTYAMANITSVNVTQKPNLSASYGCATPSLVVGGLILLTGLLGNNFWILALGLIGVGLGIAFLINNERERRAPSSYTYTLVLTSASGEIQALSTQSEAEAAAALQGIKSAIIERDAFATGAGEPPHSEARPKEKLLQLREMLDAGLITQAEYDAKKAELLSTF